MSAAEKIFQVGQGAKVVAIFAVAVGAGFFLYKTYGIGAQVIAKVQGSVGFLFSSDDAPETLGSKLQEFFNPPPTRTNTSQSYACFQEKIAKGLTRAQSIETCARELNPDYSGVDGVLLPPPEPDDLADDDVNNDYDFD